MLFIAKLNPYSIFIYLFNLELVQTQTNKPDIEGWRLV